MSRFDEAGADQWRSALRGRSDQLRCRAHPAAVRRLLDRDGILRSGPWVASQRRFDLVSLNEGVDQVYVEESAWLRISQELAIKEVDRNHNLLVKIPIAVWPFEGAAEPSDAVLAADLLEEVDPRAVAAGVERLSELCQAARP